MHSHSEHMKNCKAQSCDWSLQMYILVFYFAYFQPIGRQGLCICSVSHVFYLTFLLQFFNCTIIRFSVLYTKLIFLHLISSKL
jgi:hypothetical protein